MKFMPNHAHARTPLNTCHIKFWNMRHPSLCSWNPMNIPLDFKWHLSSEGSPPHCACSDLRPSFIRLRLKFGQLSASATYCILRWGVGWTEVLLIYWRLLLPLITTTIISPIIQNSYLLIHFLYYCFCHKSANKPLLNSSCKTCGIGLP